MTKGRVMVAVAFGSVVGTWLALQIMMVLREFGLSNTSSLLAAAATGAVLGPACALAYKRIFGCGERGVRRS